MGKGGGFGPRLSSDTVLSLHFSEPRCSLCERGSATPAVPSCQAWVCTKCSVPGGHSVRGEGAAITVVLDKQSSFVAVSQPPPTPTCSSLYLAIVNTPSVTFRRKSCYISAETASLRPASPHLRSSSPTSV